MKRKIFKWLHLWLGLLSGVVVVIVCITGGIYAFKDELTAIGEPWRKVEVERRPFLKPEQLLGVANRQAKGESAWAVTYGLPDEVVWVDYFEPESDGGTTVFLNPYSGRVLHVERHAPGHLRFFDFILRGHVGLWLPAPWGHRVVGYGVLLFLITLLTGLFLWYPKRWSKKAVTSHFTIHRPFRFKRLMFDLHQVLGFYALIPLLVVSFTGVVLALGWVSSGVYALMSGGKSYVEYVMPHTDTTAVKQVSLPLDRLYDRLSREEPRAVQFYYALPQTAADVYRVSIVHESGSYYKQDNRFFDRRSLAELHGEGTFTGRYTDQQGADKWFRMSVDIHTGRVFGLFGRMLMLLASLVGASLPITGFVLYWERKGSKLFRTKR